MTFRGINNEVYQTGRELGRGGEGTVFELQNNHSVVLKKYNEPMPPGKIAKLRHMVGTRNPEIEAYAAWPVNLAIDEKGQVCGFVMKKLTGYAPLHMIFSPMDRKKLFPDKGYNFLVHVARNLAIAFHKLHEAGLVVGDVNEGNILVNHFGVVAFIDCDSFQVKNGDQYYFCEVGVPRYTPPEILAEKAFENVVRTIASDSFSLAILIFQMMFLGRHPFAGKNKLAGDLDEEKAIRQRQFAYSLDNKRKKLHPPADSFPITNLPDQTVALFHRAFEQDERPTPAEWVSALDSVLADMMTCGESKLHSYPARLKECPWCYYKENRGILYFPDDTSTHASSVLKNMEAFVNGFNPEKLELKKWSPLPFPKISANPIARRFHSYKALNMSASIAAIFLCFILYIYFAFSGWIFIFAFGLPLVIHKYSGWTRRITDELNRRVGEYKRFSETLERMIRDHDNPPDLVAYQDGVMNLNHYVSEYRLLPAEVERRKLLAEEKLYNEQLDIYLSAYEIEHFTIPTFGPSKKAALQSGGIITAADISRLQHVKVAGIGNKNIQVLMSWRRQMATNFVYIPDPQKTSVTNDAVTTEVSDTRNKLEKQIRKEYQALNHMKSTISNRTRILEKQINELSLRTYQADLDLMAFRKFAA